MKLLNGKVKALFVTDMNGKQHKREKTVCKTEGIVGDKHFAKNTARSVLVTSIDSYEMVRDTLNVEMPYGYLGENILLDFNPYRLPPGTRLRFENGVELEVTQNCTLCNHLAVLHKKIPKLLKDDRGIFMKVVKEGTIELDENVRVID